MVSKQEQFSDSASGSDEDYDEKHLEMLKIKQQQAANRNSVSAEAFGKFNKKTDFKPIVYPKSDDQKNRIKSRLNQAFMFQNLSSEEQQIVIDAMQEKQFKAGEKVIIQGQDGDVLYVVDDGKLDCFKKFDNGKDTFLKTYVEGESFGELALLYNCPRAATIISKTESTTFALDRQTFNHIVKDSAQKKREIYDEFLQKVEILKSMDTYERQQVADCLKPKSFKKGEFICKEGDHGEEFYILEKGKCIATKIITGKEPEKVKDYQSGDYFGEIALLKDGAKRHANIQAESDVEVCLIDWKSFKRLLGPLEDILRRNMKEYEKFMQQ